MFKINDNYLKLPGSYLFADIAGRVAAYTEANPGKRIIRMGIGDVTRPLSPAVVGAMRSAAAEMGVAETFRGYAPDCGYDFLREKIVRYDYGLRGVKLSVDEVFVSDGAKSDAGNIGDILSTDNVVAVCDPVYPVYIDTNAMAGRAGDYSADGRWTRLVYMPCTPDNGFVPEPPEPPSVVPDIIYLCYPNNPTGAAAPASALKRWVNYALKHGSLILYDSAYEAYITEDGRPHSIYEIDGAAACAIEFRSYSKTAGFTGTRCAYTIIPKELKNADGVPLNALWGRRQSTKLNGVSYVVQRGAEATYTEAGRAHIRQTVGYYMENARLLSDGLKKAGFAAWGGVNAPYIWMKTPDGMGSWAFFDLLLERAGVVGTPGGGFGPQGEGYFRLTAFSSRENTVEAVDKIISAAGRV